MDFPTTFDVLVVGAGHAGVEAALAAARLGARTLLLTLQADAIGQLSCNPAIGGLAKGQLAREIDALGGEMGHVADRTGIHFRMLNTRKGPAMRSPRAQVDKRAYQAEMKRLVETQELLTIRQDSAEELLVAGDRVQGVRGRSGFTYRARSVVLTTGTFLRGLLHLGGLQQPGGRMGEAAAESMSGSLQRLGFELGRMKTGTPPRINGRTIDTTGLKVQPGDRIPAPFSFETERLDVVQMHCFVTYTNARTHEIVHTNLHRAPMYTGQIQSRGPRYCPSIEDKIVRFGDRERHQVFLEPEGRGTLEVYLNGVSTSMPPDVQEDLVHSLPGLERAEILRYGYAVEYDFVMPTELRSTLETRRVQGLYLAGQINGTTGYEEAGALGLMAGINAALQAAGRPPFLLRRDQAYIGVLIDDLITHGVTEPYRIFTSRAEFRLLLRQDNADRRLTRLGCDLGLASPRRREQLERKERQIQVTLTMLKEIWLEGQTLRDRLRRPEVTFAELAAREPRLAAANLSPEVIEQVELDVKYEGYVRRQEVRVERMRGLENRALPTDLDYPAIRELRFEAREKLARVRPASVGQAGRISGVTMADLAVLLIHLRKRERDQRGSAPSPVDAPDAAAE